MDIHLKELDKRIDEFKKSGEEIKNWLLGTEHIQLYWMRLSLLTE